ncbi:probable serine/threonine-protein kinase At1g54610 isoform X2 [Asparagus officinalis]|uniref:probable serine/threonine-protein kinase At1g54610 isoform X2 n=1 Tax=Asparagus officinalis TaxID=4686 RepID=UPI00098DE9B8|nr:probable serine/threonine-protein kinase At1g54610 isoform X2 [Asparagus officinalis]
MGCATSKKAVLVTPALDSSGILRDNNASDTVSTTSSRRRAGSRHREEEEVNRCESSGELGKLSLKSASSMSVRLGNLHKYIEGEQVAAGWPAWLSAVAGEAIQGWVPLKADSFEKLEKIGQGTYSSVFRARDLDTGKIVALKKVRFDNFEPESVRFMAREIQILRRLDHPNVIKLEGLITSRLSCSIYLVFEYMEHDLAGLSSSPDISFSESQVKCYMHQLLSGLEHCHSRGVIHRDIKGANLLVNNEGILKMADFGLANFWSPGHKQPLTSRVVTLWYRPPELLLGSTNYEASVDLWSVGCVFAELLLKKPILQGRTEVEQLHKIFKLCGSPAEEYWKKSKLPHATIFKPHRPYESCLQETFKSLPLSTFSLLETLLSVEPYKRGTASTALASGYFTTKPYACEPSSLPKYPPNKEIDAKSREESRRKRSSRTSARVNGSDATRRSSKTYRPPQEANETNRLAARPEESIHSHGLNRYRKPDQPRGNGDLQPLPSINPADDSQETKHDSKEDVNFSDPLRVNASSGFAWVKKQKDEHSVIRSHSKSSSRSHGSFGSLDPSNIIQAKNGPRSKGQTNKEVGDEAHVVSKVHEHYEIAKQAMLKKWAQLENQDSFNSSELFHSQDFSRGLYKGDVVSSRRDDLSYQDQADRVEFSGPLLSQSHKVDELLQKHERHIRHAVRRSWFQRGRKQRK